MKINLVWRILIVSLFALTLINVTLNMVDVLTRRRFQRLADERAVILHDHDARLRRVEAAVAHD